MRSKRLLDWKLDENSRKARSFSKIFKMIVEGAQVAHSIGNFILKNFITGHFLVNEDVRRYDVIVLILMILWRHTWMKWYMMSYLLTCSSYQKMSRYNVLQYEIPELFKNSLRSFWNFWKIKFQLGKIFEKPWPFASFHLIINLKTVLSS